MSHPFHHAARVRFFAAVPLAGVTLVAASLAHACEPAVERELAGRILLPPGEGRGIEVKIRVRRLASPNTLAHGY